MKILRLLPSFLLLTWLLWFSVQAKWNEVITPNIWWLLLGTIAATGIIRKVTTKKNSRALMAKNSSAEPQEKLVAREVYTWRTVTRERSIYAEPK